MSKKEIFTNSELSHYNDSPIKIDTVIEWLQEQKTAGATDLYIEGTGTTNWSEFTGTITFKSFKTK